MTTAFVKQPADSALPVHVRTAFGVDDEVTPRPVVWAGRRAWHCGDVLIRPVPDNVAAAWSAAVLDGLRIEGLRIARPVRSSDGRWVVGGWAACRFVPGVVEPRHDQVIEASFRLHEATAGVSRPRLLDDRDDLITRSAAAAFGERRIALDRATGGDLYKQLTEFRRPVQLVPQLVHPELFGNVLFAEDGVPAIIDLVPCWRPQNWAAAVIVIDAIAWGGADEALPHRWVHLQEWPQMLLRALMHRVAVHAQHPEATKRTLTGLERAASAISPLL